jgi:hypothetical protein
MALCTQIEFIMSQPKIIAYLKPSCGWSQGVRAVMRKYNLPFVETWMLANNIVTQNNVTPDAPINQPCAHEMPQSAPLNFAVRR